MADSNANTYIFSGANTATPQSITVNGAGIYLKEGTVKGYDYAKGIYSVDCGDVIGLSCKYAVSIMSGLIGLKFNTVLEPNTKVLCLVDTSRTNVAYIIGVISNASKVNDSLFNNSYVGTNGVSQVMQQLADGLSAQSSATENFNDGSMPNNLAPGESTIAAGSGAALELLHTFAALKATDLAKIECFMQDDMVRILSDTYQHISSFGDFNIYNENGQLNVQWKGTNSEAESFGNDSSGSVNLGSISDNKVDIGNPAEDFNSDGKWRFATYIGKVGNFIHLFVTDPNKFLDPDATNAVAGRFNFHVNEDGSFLCQSLSDIALEKVVRIPVAVEKKRWEDSKANDKFDAKTMRNWTTMGNENLWEMSYKLRDYGKWFSNVYCNSGFWGNSRFTNPTEAGMPDADPYAKDSARQQQDAGNWAGDFAKTQEAYATIRIFKDGTILLLDAYGNSLHMTGTGVQLSSINNLELSAANTLNIIAKDIAITGLNSFTAASTNGTAEVAGKYMARLHASQGPSIISSAASADDLTSLADGSALPTDTRMPAVMRTLKVGNPENNYASISLHTVGHNKNIIIKSPSIFISAKSFCLSSFRTVLSGIKSFSIKGLVRLKEGVAEFLAGKSRFNIIETTSVYSCKRQLPIETKLGSSANKEKSAVRVDDSIEDIAHIGTLGEDFLGDNISEQATTDLNYIFTSDFKFKRYAAASSESPLMQSITDQTLEANNDATNYEKKEISDDEFKLSANSGVPYPGQNNTIKTYSPTITDSAAQASREDTLKPKAFIQKLYYKYFKR